MVSRTQRVGPFSSRTATLLVAAGGATFLFGLLLAAYAGDVFGEPSAGTDVYSRSLIGHHALTRFLKQSELSVIVSRLHSGERAKKDFPLLLLEPVTDNVLGDPFSSLRDRRKHPPSADLLQTQLVEALTAAQHQGAPVVLVLPKWQAFVSVERPDWIRSRRPLAVERVAEVLDSALHADDRRPERPDEAPSPPADVADRDIQVVRPNALQTCRAEPLGFSTVTLDLGKTPQLLEANPSLQPLVQCAQGLLIAKVVAAQGPPLIVVADPDLLNNAGLARGDHAPLVYELLAHHLQARGVVIDETLHGYAGRGSVLSRALSFPFAVVVIHGLLTLLLAAWALSVRFGQALPPPPEIERGKQLLIDNTAALLQSSQRHGAALSRYLEATMVAVARRFSLPEGQQGLSLTERLARLSRARGIDFDPQSVRNALSGDRLPAHEALRLSRRIYQWWRELHASR